MDEPVPCLQCGAPARITERFRWLTPLAETVAGAQPHPTSAAAQLALA